MQASQVVGLMFLARPETRTAWIPITITHLSTKLFSSKVILISNQGQIPTSPSSGNSTHLDLTANGNAEGKLQISGQRNACLYNGGSVH